MGILELIKRRRSIRRFEKGRPVTDEQVTAVLEAARWAPSAGNTQCSRFFVVRNKDLKRDLAVKAGHQPFIADADVVIVVVADLDHIEKYYGERGRETYALQDTAAAIQNMLLVITDLGLATCWIGAFDEGAAAKILNLKRGLRPLAMLPIGYPAEVPKPPPRVPLDEIVTKLL